MKLRHAIIVLALLAGQSALAQTGPELLLKPWDPKQFVEARSEAIVQAQTEVEDSDEDLSLSLYSSRGRLRLQPGEMVSPRIGWSATWLPVESGLASVPQGLVDVSLAAGAFVGQFDGWVAGLTVGGGYAGSNAFSEGDAWYLRATIGVGKVLDEANDGVLAVILDYNGNRSFMPDVPLLGFAYTFRYNEQLRVAVGVPLVAVYWQPVPEFELDVTVILPSDVMIEARYHLIPELSITGGLYRDSLVFSTDTLPRDNDRLFFSQWRAEIGVDYRPFNYASIVVAGGYAFGGEFSSGWDSRDLETIADLDAAPYFRIAIRADW